TSHSSSNNTPWEDPNFAAKDLPSPVLQGMWFYPLVKSIRSEQFTKIVSWFNAVDTDRSGTLEIAELGRGTYPGNIKVSNQTALRFMRVFDSLKTGHLTIYEFVGIYRFLEICYALFTEIPGSSHLVLQRRIVALGFPIAEQSSLILYKTFASNDCLDLNNWVGVATFVLQSRANYQEFVDAGMMKNETNPFDAAKIVDAMCVMIDK
ncbi:hypothetical protein EIN_130390, partial [Entamoeba invadens IP1]